MRKIVSDLGLNITLEALIRNIDRSSLGRQGIHLARTRIDLNSPYLSDDTALKPVRKSGRVVIVDRPEKIWPSVPCKLKKATTRYS